MIGGDKPLRVEAKWLNLVETNGLVKIYIYTHWIKTWLAEFWQQPYMNKLIGNLFQYVHFFHPWTTGFEERYMATMLSQNIVGGIGK